MKIRFFSTVFRLTVAFSVIVVAFLVAGYLSLRISTYSKEVVVPDLLGKTTESALKILDEKGLFLSFDGEDYSLTIPKGRIILQNPPAGSTIKRGRSVKVIISKGMKKIMVPELYNTPLNEARIELSNIGLSVGRIIRAHHPEVAADRVIATDPQGSMLVDEGEKIDLFISQGKLVALTMPDLIGMNLSSALEILNKMGRDVNELRLKQVEGVAPNVILDQSPPFGYRILPEDSLALTINGMTKPQRGALGRFELVQYTTPIGLRKVEVKIIATDESGSRELFRKECKPGEEISVIARIISRTVVEIYLNNELVDRRIYKGEE